MARVTVTIDDDHEQTLEEIAGDGGPYSSKSEAVRELIEGYDETRTEITEYERREQEYERRIEWLETQVERLQTTHQKILEQRQENTDLQTWVDEERRRKEAGKLRAWWNDLTGWD